jgi:hypothetical protein
MRGLLFRVERAHDTHENFEYMRKRRTSTGVLPSAKNLLVFEDSLLGTLSKYPELNSKLGHAARACDLHIV